MKILTHQDVLNILPDRRPDSHKGDYGKILLLCGSRGYTGAAALAAMGALRSGAGLVYLGVPESIYAIEAVKLTEPVVFPLPDQYGKLSTDALIQLGDMLPRMDAVLIGPGLGISEGTSQIVQYILKEAKCPVVLDADGISIAASHKDILRERTSATVLTPHAGEFSRLTGTMPTDRVSNAKDAARDMNVIMVLKGHETVITDGKCCYINNTGNPGMAVGGSGDVLAGVIVSLLGQGVDPLQSAACGVWLHGAAGDVCAESFGQYGMLPGDMLNVLPRLLK